jgi:hypothetical protein
MLGAVAVIGAGAAALVALGGRTGDDRRTDTAVGVAQPAGASGVAAAPQGPSVAAAPPMERVGRGPTIDTAQVGRELDAMIDAALDSRTADATRQRAQEFYGRADLPAALRARAAFIAAQSHFVQHHTDSACYWNALARGLAPTSDTYATFARDQDCL